MDVIRISLFWTKTNIETTSNLSLLPPHQLEWFDAKQTLLTGIFVDGELKVVQLQFFHECRPSQEERNVPPS